MIQHSRPTKGCVCEHCHEEILRDIDCIGHHIKELIPLNVNDVYVILNPKNILPIHHRCHNAIHERFGQVLSQRVYIIYGASLSGKTSYIRVSKSHKDIVLDLDELKQAITLLPAYDKPTELATNVFLLRDSLLDQIKTRTGKGAQHRKRNVFVVCMMIRIKMPFRKEWQTYIHDCSFAFRPDDSQPTN